jgi:hypothetical protein
VAKILQSIVVPKQQRAAVKFIMSQSLEQAVVYLTTSLQAIRNSDWPRASAFALAASLVAGRHYAKRPEEATKVAAFADAFVAHAVDRKNAPAAAAAVMGFGAARAQSLVSQKIRTLMREGYPPKQAQAIAYSMVKKRSHVPVKGVGDPTRMGTLARTMALVKMLEAV